MSHRQPQACAGSCCQPESGPVCISMRAYRFLCCEQRTYIYVKSICAIDEVRINGEVVANPGTMEWGGLPATAPVINIGGTPVTGQFLAANSCGDCPVESEQQSETPTPISALPINCRYDVEVDTCGTTYNCSLAYCLPRVLTLYDLVFAGLTQHFECSDEGLNPVEQPDERTITYDFSITGFSFDDIQIDFCTPRESPTIISGGSITMSTTEVSTSLYGNITSTGTWVGSVSILISPYIQCSQNFFDPDNPFDVNGIFLLFTGTITTTQSGSGIPGGSITSTTSVTNFVIGTGVYTVCAGSTYSTFGFQMIGGIQALELLPVPDYPFGDLLACQYIAGSISIAVGNFSWCR